MNQPVDARWLGGRSDDFSTVARVEASRQNKPGEEAH